MPPLSNDSRVCAAVTANNDQPSGVTIVAGRFNPLVARGLVSVLSEDRDLHILADDIEYRALVPSLARLRPHVALLDRPPDSASLARLTSARLATSLLVLAHQPKPSYVALLGALEVGCIAYSSEPREILAAIRRAALVVRGAGATPTVRELPHRPSGWLTEREIQVLDLLVKEKSHRDIADALGIGVETVRTHVANIRRKLVQGTRELTHARALDA